MHTETLAPEPSPETLELLNTRFAERSVQTADGAQCFREAGQTGADGMALVLLHGIGSGAGSWLHAALELAGRTRFPTPWPVAIGSSGHGYPLPWLVQTWLPGSTADEADASTSVEFAHDLAELITGIRAIDTRGRRFAGGGRGGDLGDHDDWMRTCFARSEGLLDVPRLRRMWTVMRELPRTAPDVMTHGDLIPGNVLVSDGRLAGVLDVGGLGPADPALDLIAGWHLLEDGPRLAFRDRLGCDELEWARGRAWAFVQAMGLVWYYADTNPTMARFGRRTLDRLLADNQS